MTEKSNNPLRFASVFHLFNWLIGYKYRTRVLCHDYIRAKAGDRILDAGCGVAHILNFLPPGVHYVGFDAHLPYIAYNQRRYGHQGRFFCADVMTGLPNDGTSQDLVLAMGVLHHLNDEQVLALLSLAKTVLKPAGRFVSADGCWTPGQSFLARWVLKSDRGKFVRRQEDYEALVKQVFPHVKSTILENTLRIPHTLLVMDCHL